MKQAGNDACWAKKNPATYFPPLPPSKSLQDDDPPIVEFSDNLGAPVRFRGFDASWHHGLTILLTLDQITDVQHLLQDVYPTHSTELHALFRSLSFNNRCGHISRTTIHVFNKIFDPFVLFGWDIQSISERVSRSYW